MHPEPDAEVSDLCSQLRTMSSPLCSERSRAGHGRHSHENPVEFDPVQLRLPIVRRVHADASSRAIGRRKLLVILMLRRIVKCPTRNSKHIKSPSPRATLVIGKLTRARCVCTDCRFGHTMGSSCSRYQRGEVVWQLSHMLAWSRDIDVLDNSPR